MPRRKSIPDAQGLRRRYADTVNGSENARGRRASSLVQGVKCHGPPRLSPRRRGAGHPGDEELTRRADARRLGGPVKKHVLGPRFARTRGPGHDK